ncbi:unnamed protein product [Diabrotica balteata]|uniref:Acyltransferase 3 domain-containing protein n=1 Tax=Diabrotica balteata TaxID=107213 RepID=A0A9N9STN0_DIABA|nr:unnamed protein product [Diabrotica balteata]
MELQAMVSGVTMDPKPEYMNKYYLRTETRASPWFMGTILGYMLTRKQLTLRNLPKVPLKDLTLRITGGMHMLRFPTRAICVPSNCSDADAGYLMNQLQYPSVTIKSLMCQTKEEVYEPLDSNAYVGILIIVVIALVVIFATMYDLYCQKHKKEKGKAVLVAFSIYTNGKKLLQTHNNRTSSLDCLDGIRVLSMTWVMTFHMYVKYIAAPVFNSKESIQCVAHTWYIAVDTQLYIISPLIFYLLKKHTKLGVICLAFAILASIALSFVKGYNDNILPTVNNSYYANVDVAFVMFYFYLGTIARAAPWFMGTLLGYLLTRPRFQKPLSKAYAQGRPVMPQCPHGNLKQGYECTELSPYHYSQFHRYFDSSGDKIAQDPYLLKYCAAQASKKAVKQNKTQTISYFIPQHELTSTASRRVKLKKKYGTISTLGADFIFYDWKTTVKDVMKVPDSWNFQFKASKRFFLRKDKHNKIAIK